MKIANTLSPIGRPTALRSCGAARRAFTLVELLVVIAVIATLLLLLAAIWAFFRYSKIGVAMRAVAADARVIYIEPDIHRST